MVDLDWGIKSDTWTCFEEKRAGIEFCLCISWDTRQASAQRVNE